MEENLFKNELICEYEITFVPSYSSEALILKIDDKPFASFSTVKQDSALSSLLSSASSLSSSLLFVHT